MRVVLDTSVLVGSDPGPIDGEIAISTVSLAQLHLGVLVAPTEPVRAERLRRLAVIERTFDALPLDDVVAREYGRLAAALVASGAPDAVTASDLLIAATAVAHDASLLTRTGDRLAPLRDLIHLQSPAS